MLLNAVCKYYSLGVIVATTMCKCYCHCLNVAMLANTAAHLLNVVFTVFNVDMLLLLWCKYYSNSVQFLFPLFVNVAVARYV